MGLEEEVCRGIAYLHASDEKNLPDEQAYAWAKDHWSEFLPQLETENGQMLMRMARTRRKIPEGSERIEKKPQNRP